MQGIYTSAPSPRPDLETDYTCAAATDGDKHPRQLPPILTLPPELIDAILSHLSALDLVSLSATCHKLRTHAISDIHWQRCVQENVPGVTVTKPSQYADFRDLYATHDRLWFLPRHKTWFCDRDLVGKLIIARYNAGEGCIEAYQLVAVSNHSTPQHWPAENGAVVHGFQPRVRLHLDKPVLLFQGGGKSQRVVPASVDEASTSRVAAASNRFADDMPMALDYRIVGLFSNFLLTRPLDPEEVKQRTTATKTPFMNVWPPPMVPALHRVSGARAGHPLTRLAPQDRPRTRSEVSDQAFRIRQWIEMAGSPSSPLIRHVADQVSPAQVLARGNQHHRGGGGVGGVGGGGGGAGGRAPSENGSVSVHIGEEITTYSTLDPELYTPTPTKPWRGIWVGDYSGHGCEFVLILQPDDPPATDAELGLVRYELESDEAWEERRLKARMYRGRLEAVKLTGDPNVPRGEYTFVAEDLGSEGYVGEAANIPFTGARIVRSKGHVAATDFSRDRYIETRLMLIGPNKLAQDWVDFGHISLLERVNIDEFLVPEI